MADPVAALEAEPTPPAPEAEPDMLAEPKMTESEMTALVEALGDATQTVVSDDFSFAFVTDEPEEWAIPTGRFDNDGRQIAVKVKVKDPRRPELPTQYLNAVARMGVDKASLGLWQAFIVEPKFLKNPAMFEKTTTSFRATLTERLLVKAGLNGDFLAARLATNSQAPQPGRKSGTTSPPASAGPSSTSTTSPPPTSSTPTSKPDESATVAAPSV